MNSQVSVGVIVFILTIFDLNTCVGGRHLLHLRLNVCVILYRGVHTMGTLGASAPPSDFEMYYEL